MKRGRGWEGGSRILLHVVEEVAVTCRREGVCKKGALWKVVDFLSRRKKGRGDEEG